MRDQPRRRSGTGIEALVFVSAALLGCGGHPGSVSGTINGNSFNPADAIFFVTANGNVVTTVIMATTDGICGRLSSDQSLKSAQALTLSLVASGTVTAGQNFDVNPSGRNSSEVIYGRSDPTCHEIDDSSAASGKIIVTAVSGDTLSGTFDVMMGVGAAVPRSHIIGTFNASSCDRPIAPVFCP
jgi:hypothetical protein